MSLIRTTISGLFLVFIIGYITSLKVPGAIQSVSSTPPKTFTIMKANVSAYCPCEKCCGRFSDGITANGYKIKTGDRFVAADEQFTFRTKIYIPGYGFVEVKDRGGAIKENRLDVYFDTHQEALNWGRQFLEVKIYDN